MARFNAKGRPSIWVRLVFQAAQPYFIACAVTSTGTYLIKKLVSYDKVVSERLLLQLIEVVYKDLLQLVQEQQHRCGIHILPCDHQQVQIGVLHVHVAHAICLDDGSDLQQQPD